MIIRYFYSLFEKEKKRANIFPHYLFVRISRESTRTLFDVYHPSISRRVDVRIVCLFTCRKAIRVCTMKEETYDQEEELPSDIDTNNDQS